MENNFEYGLSDMELFEERPELLILQNSAYIEAPLPKTQKHIALNDRLVAVNLLSERIRSNKSLIGRGKVGPNVLTRQKYIGQDLRTLRNLFGAQKSSNFFNHCEKNFTYRENAVLALIEYSLFINEFPGFCFSSIQHHVIRNNVALFRQWLKSDNAKMRTDPLDKLSTLFWQGPPPAYSEFDQLSSELLSSAVIQ